ncbi:hypothetical protein ACLOJK_019120, partial [Asimina triloba]
MVRCYRSNTTADVIVVAEEENSPEIQIWCGSNVILIGTSSPFFWTDQINQLSLTRVGFTSSSVEKKEHRTLVLPQ